MKRLFIQCCFYLVAFLVVPIALMICHLHGCTCQETTIWCPEGLFGFWISIITALLALVFIPLFRNALNRFRVRRDFYEHLNIFCSQVLKDYRPKAKSESTFKNKSVCIQDDYTKYWNAAVGRAKAVHKPKSISADLENVLQEIEGKDINTENNEGEKISTGEQKISEYCLDFLEAQANVTYDHSRSYIPYVFFTEKSVLKGFELREITGAMSGDESALILDYLLTFDELMVTNTEVKQGIQHVFDTTGSQDTYQTGREIEARIAGALNYVNDPLFDVFIRTQCIQIYIDGQLEKHQPWGWVTTINRKILT